MPDSWCAQSKFPDWTTIEREMWSACQRVGLGNPLRIRVTIGHDVLPHAQAFPLERMPPYPIQLVFDDRATDYSDPFMRYKTTHRTTYDTARLRHGATLRPSDNEQDPPFDVILFNDRNQVTETTIANIAFKFDDSDTTWLTPSSECGLLEGVQRQEMLENKELREEVIQVTRVEQAAARGSLQIICLNGVRGVFPARLRTTERR
ncbi:hypothetical protein OIV83_003461 [Microbotryomycetes sp. JL201]|nr:hypothetical protein OIV83_003461 [Microbotryomycetes sp. JL201]